MSFLFCALIIAGLWYALDSRDADDDADTIDLEDDNR